MTQSEDDSTGAQGGTEVLTESDRHRLLAVERRRLTIDILAGRTGPVELEDLAAGVAARETGVDAADEGTVERVAMTLHHVHLPRMDDFGVVDYDPDANRVESCTAPPVL